jgi:dephospho-CoA kinase
VEAGLTGRYGAVVVVEATESIRLERLHRDRGMTEAEARARMAAQATDDQRRAVATYLIRNDGSLADLDAQVDRVWVELLSRRS